MTDNNLDLWRRLAKVDKKSTKGFNRQGGFKGTAIDPLYRIMRMTEEFGPCGTGWTIGEPHFEFQSTPDNKVLVFCKVSVTVGDGMPVWGVGGNQVYQVFPKTDQRPYEKRVSNDEGCKMAFTDAVMNALKSLGMAAEIYMGQFDADKYAEAGGHDAGAGQNSPPKDDEPRRKSSYQSNIVKTQDQAPATDPLSGVDDELPPPNFTTVKQIIDAVEAAKDPAELELVEEGFQLIKDKLKPPQIDKVCTAMDSRFSQMNEAAA